MLSKQLAVGTTRPTISHHGCPLLPGGMNAGRIGLTMNGFSLLIGGLQTLPPKSPDHRTALAQRQLADRFVQIWVNVLMQGDFYDELCHDGRVIYAATAA